MQQYVPLHLHTEYSLLDGATRIKELVKHAKDNNMPAAAITDHGVMYGAIEFYRTAKENGVKPLIGCEFYVHNSDIKDKDPSNNPLHHLVLIAKNKEGYKNLVKLISIAQVEGFYYKARINKELLEQHKDGIICLSACLGGELCQNILRGYKDKALETAEYFKNLFGEDYYIELQDHGMEDQKRSNPELIKIAKELDIEMVITNDSHYTKKQDAQWHDILLCLQTGKTVNEPGRFKFPNNEFYIKTVDELRDSFNWMEQAMFERCIENTVTIANKCNLIIDMGTSLLPNFEVPANHTIESYLHFKVREGIEKNYGEITPELEKRAQYELKIIEDMGFAAYFLIVWDFIHYAKENDIPVGPGRGSAAGSLVAYSLGITDLDPIGNNLLFERFLNPERISMPDVDIDFCIDRREKVIEYVANRYGDDKVCQIITFGTLAARAAMKGVARVLDIPYAESDKYAKLIPQAPGTKISDALNDGMELKQLYDSNEQVKELVDLAKAVEGIKFNVGTHAAGVIISRDPLNEMVPVQNSKDGIIVTQYPMSDLEKLGLLKMDFLGLRNLTIIDSTVKMVKQRKGIEIDINNIAFDDKPTYELLSNGETDGVFQLESSGMKMLVKDLKPSVFEDLGALVALYRPGPLNSGMVKVFVDRKHGREKVEYAHPALEPILKDTYGTIVYQEQIMQIAQSLADYSLGQADILRRAMGKKKAEEMDKQRSIFLDGATKNGVDPKVSNELFDTMTEFAAYCFNRSHSAAYAFLAYQTAYLKTHHPVEYLSALLSSVSNDQDKTQLYIAECQRMGIKVLAPDINKSCANFTPDDTNIRFGLASIKNVGLGVIEAIEEERAKGGEFTSFYEFLTRVNAKSLNKRTLESLIKAGAFSNIEKSRQQLLHNMESAISSAQREIEQKASGQVSLFAALGDEDNTMAFTLNGSDEELTDSDIQAFEKELLGFYVTSHPLSSIVDKLPFLTTHRMADLPELRDGTYVTICGLISSMRQVLTKKNKPLKFGVIEDLTGNVEFVAFSSVLDKYDSLITAEAKVILAGKLQQRGDDESSVSLIIDSVKSVDNCNIVNLNLDSLHAFEDIVLLKDLLLQHKGGDPVILNMNNEGKPVKILASSNFWVNASNDLQHTISKQFNNEVSVSFQSLDT